MATPNLSGDGPAEPDNSIGAASSSTERTPLLAGSSSSYTASPLRIARDGRNNGRRAIREDGEEDENGDRIDPNEFDLLLSRSASIPHGGMLEPESVENAMLRGPRRYSRASSSSARRRGSAFSRSRSRTMSVSSQAVAEEQEEGENSPGDRTPRANGGGGASEEATPLLSGAGSEPNGTSGAGQVPDAGPDVEAASKSPFLGGLSVGRFWLIFGQILLTYFTACFDGTIMASSHPVITSYFHSSNSASWLSTAFLLTSTSFQPIVGRLSDSLGRKRPYVITMSIFTLATLWCALAGSMTSFIFARAVCGLGAGGMMTLGSIILSDMVPIELRGTYQSYVNIIYGIASASGAALGGFLADTLGWRWEFGIQVPALFLCVCIAIITVPHDIGLDGKTPESFLVAMKAFDLRGSILLMTSITFLILGLNLGGNILAWSHPFVITSLVVFTVCCPLFLYNETRAARPIMPLHLIRTSPFANLIFSNLIASMLLNAIIFNIPLFFQGVLLTSATSSGLRLVLPSVIASIAGTATGFLITYTRRLKWPLVLGTLLYLAGTLSLAGMRRGWSDAVYLLCLVPSSLGQGFQFPGSFMAILAASPQREQAVVTSTLVLWRSVGMVLGVASSSLVVQNALVRYLEAYVTGVDGNEAERRAVIERVRSSVEAIRHLSPHYREQVVRSYEAALRLTFLCCAGFALVSVLLVLPLKLPRLAARK